MVEPRFIRWIKVHLFGIHSPSLGCPKTSKEWQDMKVFTNEQIDQMLNLIASCQATCILGNLSRASLDLISEYLGSLAYDLDGEKGMDKVLSQTEEIVKSPLGKDTNHD